MASRFVSKIFTLSLTIALCLTAIPAHALADSPEIQEQAIKFYLDPALAPDINFAKAVLPKYVADMNFILSKNTNRRLVFDPETNIILTTTKPHTDSAKLPLPTEGFEIWAYIVPTSSAISFGGYPGVDKSGAGVLAGLNWTRIYDPENLDTIDKVVDYTTQLDHMLHEFSHVFGGGIGEYYNLASVTDTTGLAPLLNIRLSDQADSFWSNKTDFMTDPLLRFTRTSSRDEYLTMVRYSNLTATVINGPYRNGIPPFDQYIIQVLDRNGLPVPNANVKIWNVKGINLNPSELLFDTASDENGQVILPWGGSSSTHSADNFLRLIKVYKDGRSIAQPRFFSIYDADSAMLVSAQNPIILTMEPGPTEEVSFLSMGTYDGWVLESAHGSQKGNALNIDARTFFLGDDAANRQYRAVLHFDTSSLPDNAIITGISLKILKQSANGQDPFTTHGNLLVDIRQGYFNTQTDLQPADFRSAPSRRGVGAFDPTPIKGWYTADLGEQSYASVNRTGTTQFRIYFSKNDDDNLGADFIRFFSGNAGPTTRPKLIIQYYVP